MTANPKHGSGSRQQGLRIWDVARGAYIRSPAIVRRSLAPLISLLPARVKFGKTYHAWRERIARAAADPARSHDEHLAALRSLIGKAHATSPFYRDMIDRAFGPGFDLSTLMPDDLRRLPVIGKAELRAAGDDALCAPKYLLDTVTTSGSNSEPPFSLYLDKDRSAREMAFVYDVWSRIGFSEEQTRVCLRGFGMEGQQKHQWDPALRELRLAVFPMAEEDASSYLDLIDRYGAEYIYGYGSAIELLCRHMRKLGRRPRRPIRGIMPISEPLFDHQRSLIRATLGSVSFACFYGLSEKVLFASTVAGEDEVYEFDPLYGLAELVDAKGDPVTRPGQEGRLVGTGFLSTGMPFIRYDTGDCAELVAPASRENGQRMRVRALTPQRKPGYLVAADGSRIVTVALTDNDEKLFSGIAEYQFLQEKAGFVVIRYIPDAGGTPADAARIAAHLQRVTQNRLTFATEAVTKIACGCNGKRSFIDQRLDWASAQPAPRAPAP
jgi:phenylacetate-CoA ligase